MVTVSSPELIQFAAAFAHERFGPAEARALGDAYDEFSLQRRRALAPVAWWVDGRDFRSFYEVLADPKAEGKFGELRLGGPVSHGPEHIGNVPSLLQKILKGFPSFRPCLLGRKFGKPGHGACFHSLS